MESKNTTNFEAKTEQKINYPLDFGSLHRRVGKSFLPVANFRCSVIKKLKYTWSLVGHVVLQKMDLNGKGGGHICLQ